MSNYLVDRKVLNKNITYMEYDLEGYILNPKNNNEKYIKIKNVNIFQEQLVNNLLLNKYNSKLNRLSQIIINLINASEDETDEGDCLIVLDEIDRLKAVLDIKIKKQLTIDEYNDYLNQLDFLHKQIDNKIIELNYHHENKEELQETKGRSR
jgi:hypothetical protein